VSNQLDPIRDYDEISKWIDDNKKCRIIDEFKQYSLQLVSDMTVSVSDSPDWKFYRKAVLHAEFRNTDPLYESDYIVVRCGACYYVVRKPELP
jgi:uncharacterized protein YcsI (UPF0317 family)